MVIFEVNPSFSLVNSVGLILSNVSANATDDECQTACELPIILASPQKFLNCLNKNLYRVQSLILLVVLETSKISKCQEYREVNY